MLESVIEKLDQLRQAASDKKIASLLLGHSDGTLQKLVLQCAAISNTDFNLQK